MCVYIYIYIYKTRLASNEIFSTSHKIHQEVGPAKVLSDPCVCVCVCVYIYICIYIYIQVSKRVTNFKSVKTLQYKPEDRGFDSR